MKAHLASTLQNSHEGDAEEPKRKHPEEYRSKVSYCTNDFHADGTRSKVAVIFWNRFRKANEYQSGERRRTDWNEHAWSQVWSWEAVRH
jgi:hypothetical protein